MGRHIPANRVTGLNEETLRHYQVMVDLAPYNQLDLRLRHPCWGPNHCQIPISLFLLIVGQLNLMQIEDAISQWISPVEVTHQTEGSLP